MKIQINRQMKVILLKWLQQGCMNTDDLPDLNKSRDNFFGWIKQADTETKYTADDLKCVPTELLVQVAQYIQDARYKREQTK